MKDAMVVVLVPGGIPVGPAAPSVSERKKFGSDIKTSLGTNNREVPTDGDKSLPMP
jgi:hypothetical protein